ncbi:hypothetical protein N7495_000747 [Penicillium taxi]|uniref:uncharacterized protein n=1 Tax=Penicillium taxi TaxID=168475 RepID=UPI0025455BC5|nr:uncharacterized protein N7495_000747 [Penicillium taxi]KAJ5908065.1 hypothetical protein N7495_000747 [Penicillium taxi]
MDQTAVALHLTDKNVNIVLGLSVCDFLVNWIHGVLPEGISSNHKPTEYVTRRAHVCGIDRYITDDTLNTLSLDDTENMIVLLKIE